MKPFPAFLSAAASLLLPAAVLWAYDPQPPPPVEKKAQLAENDSYDRIQSMAMSFKPKTVEEKKVKSVLDSIGKNAGEEPDRTKRQAIIAASLGDLNEAARGLDAKSADPETIKQIANGAAYLNNRASNWEEGRSFADKVLTYDPEDRDAYINRSNANYGLKNYQSSFDDAQRAAKIDPNSSGAYTARALAAYGMQDYLHTLEDARRALAIDPADKTAFSLMKLAEGRVPSLKVTDQKSRAEAEVHREYHGMIAQLNEVETKRMEPPTQTLPRSVERLLHGAASKIALKDYNGALDDTEQATREDPNNAAAYYYRAAAYNLLGRYEDASQNATLALALNPSDAASRDARAWAMNHMGRFHDAMADANHSLEINPKNAYAYANRAFANEKLGDLDAMLHDFKTASELNAQFEPVYHDAAAMNNIDLAKLPAGKPKGQAPAAPLRKPAARRDQFWVVLASSIIGGFLIALGFIHVMSPAEKTAAGKPQAAAAAAPAQAHGPLLANYTMGKKLGQGGMGIVYEAVDRALQRKVAIKVLREEFSLDSQAKQRFLEEARTVAALHHSNIVDIHSIIDAPDGLYLVFEHIEGQTVDDLLAQKKRLSLGEAKAILKHVCRALKYAHEHDIVHRDLKPGNIMLTTEGRVKVMDFGISRHAADIVTARGGHQQYAMTSSVVGTPYYMAPEQEYGVVRKESDLFSLGACLYEMVTGERPYPAPASSAQKLTPSYPKPSQLVKDLPLSLDRFVDAVLHPDPDQRVRTAKDFWSLLERIKDSTADTPAPYKDDVSPS